MLGKTIEMLSLALEAMAKSFWEEIKILISLQQSKWYIEVYRDLWKES